ncbi:hypothetical protein GOP47_0000912 [Adiantum capillus-veneris]|uniref:Uncharacterized protein n=1 Tax=Adiantum capillus-veneris TaxID=13818 RepID=A0A9D4ZR63_ADICA|nr:hypothetical protein GOP47_0000912 [Adiantum capillus-veneris]
MTAAELLVDTQPTSSMASPAKAHSASPLMAPLIAQDSYGKPLLVHTMPSADGESLVRAIHHAHLLASCAASRASKTTLNDDVAVAPSADDPATTIIAIKPFQLKAAAAKRSALAARTSDYT